jgi:single-stranded-DNA-specific exonuclease
VDEDHLPNAHTIAFQIGPRINAASRMAHARMAHDLLMTAKPDEARLLALELEAQNQSRQKVSEALAREVRAVAENLYRDKKLIFAVGEHYPLGVAGLVAGKIAHEFGKPTAVFSKGETESTGSFRSIPALNIIEAIGECAELLERFGGHAQAAGATILNTNLEAFYEKLEGIVNKKLAETDMTPTLDIDLELSPFHITSDFSIRLKRLEPFGIGNPEPTFLVRDVTVEEARLVGNGEKHVKFSFKVERKVFGGIGFGMGEAWGNLQKGERVDVVFHLEENRWNGSKRLEWRVLDIRRKEE